MKCFYHNDLDGECSAAIVRKKFGSNKIDEYIPMDYSKDIPFDDIGNGESVVIVDFSFQKDGDFEKLFGITDDVIWIDHHKTSIEKHYPKFKIVDGIRGEGGKSNPAGCLLTWNFFFDVEAPKAVKLISDYDSWTYSMKDTAMFKMGMDCINTDPITGNWIHLFNGNIESIIEIGIHAEAYKKKYYANLIKGLSFKVEFEGFTGIACNAAYVNSTLFDTVEKTDLMLPFYFNGEQFTVSIYSVNDKIDCSEIAKKYGGGGHKGAAGFQCKELPFEKMWRQNET